MMDMDMSIVLNSNGSTRFIEKLQYCYALVVRSGMVETNLISSCPLKAVTGSFRLGSESALIFKWVLCSG